MGYRWFSPESPQLGEYVQITVPEGMRWRVIVAGCVLHTGAAVTPLPRVPNLEFKMPDGLWVYWRYGAGNQRENQDCYYFWVAEEGHNACGFERAFYAPLPASLWLPAGSMIELGGDRIQATDQIQALRFYVEELPL